jgi:hypothetical protein
LDGEVEGSVAIGVSDTDVIDVEVVADSLGLGDLEIVGFRIRVLTTEDV